MVARSLTLGLLFVSVSTILGNPGRAGEVLRKPYIDRVVQQAINNSEKGDPSARHNARLPVLVTFHRQETDYTVRSNAVRTLRQRSMERREKFLNDHPLLAPHAFEDLWIIEGLFVEATPSDLQQIAQDPTVKGLYWSERPIKLSPLPANPMKPANNEPKAWTYGLKKIGVPELRRQFPHLLGTGVRVGILDTGITPQHPDLKDRLKVYRNFSPARDDSPRDEFGHGTHVAGTIAGGAQSGTAIGVAPDVQLIVGRIFDANGGSDRKRILQAMEWIADPDGDPQTADFAQVVNSSWGDDDPYRDRRPEDEPFCQVVQAWVNLGIIPVFSAGNSGPSAGTIGLPAGCPDAFSVGATEQYDRSPHFSSTGPAVWLGQEIMKPEVSAPGMAVKSAIGHRDYEELSGTSMAAPHVTGAFAILLQANPGASVFRLQRALRLGAKDLGKPGQDALFGWGRIELLSALSVREEEHSSHDQGG